MITTTTELEELIDGTTQIPTIPTLLTQVTKIVESPDGSAKQAGNLIEKDPAIATRILRLVNSPFYGLRRSVSSIHLACSILGLNVIKNLVVQASVLQTFEAEEASGFDATWLWDHSFKTAVACRMLAERSPIAHGLSKEDAYTCGLIHDIGKMILLASQRERFVEALALSHASSVPLAKAESALFGFHHAHIGGLLAQRWKLAPAVQAAVAYHHSPATDPTDWARGFLVQAANTFAHKAASQNGGYRGDLCDEDALEALHLTREQAAEIAAAVASTGID